MVRKSEMGRGDSQYADLAFLYTKSSMLPPLVGKVTCWWSLGKTVFKFTWLKLRAILKNPLVLGEIACH